MLTNSISVGDKMNIDYETRCGAIYQLEYVPNFKNEKDFGADRDGNRGADAVELNSVEIVGITSEFTGTELYLDYIPLDLMETLETYILDNISLEGVN